MSRGLQVGDVVAGKYILIGELGQGGMGLVYEGVHSGLGRSVAVKTLRPEFVDRADVVQRFRQEARAASSIGHPSICAVFDFGQLDDGTMFLVMERLVGEPLDERIARLAPLDPRAAIDIMVQVLAGLAAAHDKGIVHRDLKPENIFLCQPDDDVPVVKLLDFGVSKVLRPLDLHETAVNDAVTRTVIGAVVGTPLYMAPEQAFGVPDLDTRADIWGAGVVLYELLTATTPFAGQSFPQIVESMVMGNIPAPSRQRADLPPVFDRIVTKALAKERDDRFQSALEMRSELLALTGSVARDKSEQAATVSPPPGRQVAKPSRWHSTPSKPALDAEAFAALDGGELISLDGQSVSQDKPVIAKATHGDDAFRAPDSAFESPEIDLDSAPVKLAYDPRPKLKPAPVPRPHKTLHPAVFTVLLLAALAGAGYAAWRLGLL